METPCRHKENFKTLLKPTRNEINDSNFPDFFLARDMILRHLLRTAQVLKHSQMRVFLTLNVLKNDLSKIANNATELPDRN